MRRHLFLMMVLAPLAALPAWAQKVPVAPAYDPQDIIEHFAPKSGGATRALCIGTPDECAKKREAAKPKSFDLEVSFELNSDTLTAPARQNLDQFATALADPRLNGFKFDVDGHTDARGRDEYNMTLSERRAKAVVAYLAQKGVDGKKLAPRGFGKQKPKTDDPFDGANRRVETRLAD